MARWFVYVVKGNDSKVKLNRVIRKKLEGENVAGEVNAVIAANINEPGHSHTSVSSKSRIVQRNGKTIVDEHEVKEER